MKGPLAVVVILAAALTLATVAGAGPEATKQRVRIDLRIDQGGLVSGTFVLTPLKAGPIKRDWGRHYRRPTFPDGLWVFVGMRHWDPNLRPTPQPEQSPPPQQPPPNC